MRCYAQILVGFFFFFFFFQAEDGIRDSSVTGVQTCALPIYLSEPAEIDDAGVSRAAGDDRFRLVLVREALDLLEVDALVLPAHPIGHDVGPLARQIHRRAVGQGPARGQVWGPEKVAGPQLRPQSPLVSLRPP